jgi:hypothetical protein
VTEEVEEMSYRSCVLKGLYVCRWGRQPEVDDVRTYSTEIANARENQGRPLVGLFIMPPDSSAPGDDFRKAQANKLPEIMSNLRFAVAVFEGEGFISSLKRSALIGILLLAPKKYSIHVRSSVEEALLTNPPGMLDFDVHQTLTELKRRDLC